MQSQWLLNVIMLLKLITTEFYLYKCSLPHNDVECPRLNVSDADDAVDLRHGPREHGPEHRRVGAQHLGADLHPLSEGLVSNLRKL